MGNCHGPFFGEGDMATCSLLPDKLRYGAIRLKPLHGKGFGIVYLY